MTTPLELALSARRPALLAACALVVGLALLGAGAWGMRATERRLDVTAGAT